MNEKQAQLATELQRLLAAGGYRTGALFVTCDPLPGPELDTRVISTIGAPELTPEVAPDLVNLCRALRIVADDLESKWQPRRAPVAESALDLIDAFGGIEGEHHKQWVLDQVVRVLTGPGYEAWVARHCDGEDGPETYSWDTGIAP